MPKGKRKLRGFRCGDTLWELFKVASREADMSTNEWVLTAIRQALKDGVQGEGGVDVEAVSSLAQAQALSQATSSVEQVISAMERSQKYWSDQLAELKKLEKQLPMPNQRDENKRQLTVWRMKDKMDAWRATAKAHGTTMSALGEKLIADFQAKPKREQKRILEE